MAAQKESILSEGIKSSRSLLHTHKIRRPKPRKVKFHSNTAERRNRFLFANQAIFIRLLVLKAS